MSEMCYIMEWYIHIFHKVINSSKMISIYNMTIYIYERSDQQQRQDTNSSLFTNTRFAEYLKQNLNIKNQFIVMDKFIAMDKPKHDIKSGHVHIQYEAHTILTNQWEGSLLMPPVTINEEQLAANLKVNITWVNCMCLTMIISTLRLNDHHCLMKIETIWDTSTLMLCHCHIYEAKIIKVYKIERSVIPIPSAGVTTSN